MRSMMYILFLCLVCIPRPESVAGQTREFSDSVDFEPGGSLSINTQRGTVKLTTWNQAKVEVSARIEAPEGVSRSNAEEAVESVQIDVNGSARSLTIRTVYDDVPYYDDDDDGWGHSRRLPQVHYEIHAPRQLDLDLEIERVHSTLEGIEGRVHIASERGNIDGKDWQGDIVMRLERGEVRLSDITGAIDLDLERVNVEIDRWQIDGNSRVSSERGSVYLQLPEDQGLDLRADVGARGDFDSDFQITARNFRRNKIEGIINGGGPRLYLQGERTEFRLRPWR
jgi:hypothetical protein